MQKKRIKDIIILLIIINILGIIYLYLNKNYGFYIPCIFRKITGLYCPGCGATRSIIALLKGNIKASFSYNPLFFLMLPFLIFSIIYQCYIYIENKKDNIINKIPNTIWIIIIIILIIFGILRNIKGLEFLQP